MEEQILTDHDLLIKLTTQVDYIRSDIKDLKDGTAKKISDLEAQVKLLEDWKNIHCQENKDTSRNNGNYMKLIIAVGVAILGFVIWHVTGYKI